MTGLPAEREEALKAIEEWLARRPDGHHYTPSEIREQASSLWTVLASGGSGEAPAGRYEAALREIGRVAHVIVLNKEDDQARLDRIVAIVDAALRGPVGQNDLGNEGGYRPPDSVEGGSSAVVVAPERFKDLRGLEVREVHADDAVLISGAEYLRKSRLANQARGPVGGEAGRDG